MSDDNKILVLQATGKAGRNIALALKDAGFEVFGTTRSAKNNLASKGITPVIANYTVQADIDRAIKESGAKKVIGITDFFKAAKSRSAVEIAHGQAQFEACKAVGVAPSASRTTSSSLSCKPTISRGRLPASTSLRRPRWRRT